MDEQGTALINGKPAELITPFQGEWKRAAIIYFEVPFLHPSPHMCRANQLSQHLSES